MTARKRATRALPPLPKEMALPAGPYRVIRAVPVCDKEKRDEYVFGECDVEARTITIRPGLSRTVAHMTLQHELVHAILFDAGVKLSGVKEECVCDAIAAHRVFEMNQQ